jgi:hypothetical protein
MLEDNMTALKLLAITAATSLVAGAANAAVFIVDALANSSSGGVGVASIGLTAGQHFTVSVDPGDLWNAGPLPRWSNADGLSQDLLATGTDDSHEAAGTLIGQDFGTWTQGNLTAPFGTLVGEINGQFAVLGTDFSGAAWQTGTLTLYYWDSNNADNTDFITASVNTLVPEPASWALMIMGFSLAGATLRRRRAKQAVA